MLWLRLLLGLGLGLVLCLALALGTSALYFPITTARTSVDDGHYVFDLKCTGCHSADPSAGTKMGPNLGHIGELAKTRKPGYSAAEFILESILEPDAHREPGVEGHMPKGVVADLSPASIKNLVAYLASRGAEPNFADVANLKFEVPKEQNVTRKEVPVAVLQKGYKLFNEELGCSGCHGFWGEPGEDLIAPSLSHAGQLSREYIMESLREPSKFIVPGYRGFTASTATGEFVVGRLLQESDSAYRVKMQDKHGHQVVREYHKSELSNVNIADTSIMPPYILQVDDEYALVSFLKFIQAVH